ncbi:MAG: zinc ribbon domain-containing protein [Candidatus Gastranaerophilaceae bacterium]
MQEQNMNCPYCGELIPNNSKKCPACNESLEDYYILCPACAESIPKDSKKCPVCGEYLGDLSMNINAPILSANINIIKVLIIIFSVVAILIVLGLGSWFVYKWYNDPVRKADRMAKSYLTLAKKQEKEGNNKEAISYYKKALYEKFDLDDVKVTLVKLCIKEKDTACVEEYIDAAYKINPKDNQLKFYYASTILDEPNSAVPLLKSVVDKEPNNYLANKYFNNKY